MGILIVAGYQFVSLFNLLHLKQCLQKHCEEFDLKGTILLSPEGINLMLAGINNNIFLFLNFIRHEFNYKIYTNAKKNFLDFPINRSLSETIPYQRLKIKIKKVIIPGQADMHSGKNTVRRIQPKILKKWLDEKKPLTLLDVRNSYEIQYGSFSNAKQLNLKNFSEFSTALPSFSHGNNPIVMFCTGGIRCEKAALIMSEHYSKFDHSQDLFQLEGGILNYFAQTGQAHFHGHCFVFDERVFVTVNHFKNINNLHAKE